MERRLAAIMAADVVGYTRLMGADEAGTLRRLTELRERVLGPLISDHHGRVVKLMGDGLLVEFASLVDAVGCAVAWQSAVALHEAEQDQASRLAFRIGINLGDVIVEGDDIHGDGVNIASRLEGLAEPGGVCLSGDAYRQVRGKIKAVFEDLGESNLKNVAEPVRIYRIASTEAGAVSTNLAGEFQPRPNKPSIAVIPFANMSGDPEQEHISDGITEDIIALLTRYRSLQVTARNSTFSYKGQPKDVRTISRELGVRYVLEGSVRRSKTSTRVTAQLIDAESGLSIWSERFDRNLREIFEVQDEIANLIVSAVCPEVGHAEQSRAHRRAPGNLDAWEWYQRGLRHLYRFEFADLVLARRHFDRAIHCDSEFAAAHSGLAYAILQEVMYSDPEEPAKMLDDALRAAQVGVALDDHDAFAYFALGRVHVLLHELDVACLEFEKAIDLNPSFAYPYFGLGIALLDLAKFEPALEQFETAQRLSPRDPHAWAFIHYQAWPLLGLKRHEEVVATERVALRSPNAGFWPYIPLIAALGHLGRHDDARKELERLEVLQPGYSCAKAESHMMNAVNPIIEDVMDGLRKAGLPE